jgi:hypothetical protein
MFSNKSISRVISISREVSSTEGNPSHVLRDGWGLPIAPGGIVSRQKQNNNLTENEESHDAA